MEQKDRAIDIFTDFLSTIFLLAMVSFVIFFIVAGDRVNLAEHFVRTIMPFSLFGILFFVVLKIKRREMKKEKEQFTLDNVVVYLAPRDITKDKLVILFILFAMVMPNLIDRALSSIDVMQVIVVLIYLMTWHYIKFRSAIKNISQPGLTRQDIIKDEIVIFALPLISMIVPIISMRINIIDIMQAVIPLVIMYIWRKILYHHSV